MSEGISQPDAPLQADQTAPCGDLFSKFDALIKQREDLLANGVEDPFSLVMEKVLSPTRAICNGRDTILLGTGYRPALTYLNPGDLGQRKGISTIHPGLG